MIKNMSSFSLQNKNKINLFCIALLEKPFKVPLTSVPYV
jgi:hypothetical protein